MHVPWYMVKILKFKYKEKVFTSYQNKMFSNKKRIILVPDFSSAILQDYEKIKKKNVYRLLRRVTNGKFCVWPRYHLSIKAKEVHFQIWNDFSREQKKTYVRLIFSYNIIIENIEINTIIRNRTVAQLENRSWEFTESERGNEQNYEQVIKIKEREKEQVIL